MAPPRSPWLRAGAAAAVAAAVLLGAHALQRRLDLPPPGTVLEGRDPGPGERALRTGRSLARLEQLDPLAEGSPVVLNEIAPANDWALLDETGEPTDWLELYNRGDAPVSLAGWSVADGRSAGRRWVLPDVTLPAGGHRIVFASGRDRAASVLARRVAARLEPGPPGLLRIPADRARAVPPEPRPGPFGRVELALPLPAAGPFDLWLSLRAPDRPARVAVEVEDGAGRRLGRHVLVLVPSARLRHLRGAEGIAGPGVRRVVLVALEGSAWVERASFALARPVAEPAERPLALHLHADFRLGREGETLVLLDAAGRARDYATPERFEPGRTWQRVPDGAAAFRLARPTPRGRPLAPAPDLSGLPAVAPGPVRVEVPLPPGVNALRYTLDGSVPDRDAPRLDGPLRLERTGPLRVRGFREGAPATPVATRQVWIGPPPRALTVLLALAPAALDDPEHGIVPNNAARGRAWERVAHVLVLDGEAVLYDGDAGLRTHAGNGTDRGAETAFQVRWRGSLGAPRLDADPFAPRLEPPPDRLILDAMRPAWTDKVAYDLVRAAGGQAARSRLGVVFVNGALHNRAVVFEDVDDHFLLSRFGHLEFDLLKGKPFRVKRGDLARLGALARRLERGELADAAAVARHVDLAEALAAHLTLVLVDATEGGRFPDDAVQGYLALDRRRDPPLLHPIAWDLDKSFREGGAGTLARHRAFVHAQPWDTRYLPEKAIDALLRRDPAFRRRYAREWERFLALAAQPRWEALLEEIAAWERRWALPRGADEATDPAALAAFREGRAELVSAAWPFLLRRREELAAGIAEAVAGVAPEAAAGPPEAAAGPPEAAAGPPEAGDGADRRPEER